MDIYAMDFTFKNEKYKSVKTFIKYWEILGLGQEKRQAVETYDSRWINGHLNSYYRYIQGLENIL